MRQILHPVRLWAPVYMMTGISILSGSAGVQAGSWAFAGIDKLAHFAVFGLLGIAWARAFRAAAVPGRLRLLVAVALTTLFGLADELHQLQNPLRTFEWADLLADFAGALAGTALYLRVRWLQAVLELDLRHPARLRLARAPANSPG